MYCLLFLHATNIIGMEEMEDWFDIGDDWVDIGNDDHKRENILPLENQTTTADTFNNKDNNQDTIAEINTFIKIISKTNLPTLIPTVTIDEKFDIQNNDETRHSDDSGDTAFSDDKSEPSDVSSDEDNENNIINKSIPMALSKNNQILPFENICKILTQSATQGYNFLSKKCDFHQPQESQSTNHYHPKPYTANPINIHDAIICNHDPRRIQAIIMHNQTLINQQDFDNGNTPIMTAFFRKRFNIIRLLIQNEADLDLKNHDGKTIFDIADESGKINILNDLLTTYKH